MTKNNNSKGAPVFAARDFPPASFSLATDGRKARQRCRDRRALYLQLTSHGLTAWPSVAELASMMDWSERKTYNVLADLKKLGCLPNATNAKGLKYTKEHGTRVRSVVNDALLERGSSRWLPVTDCPTTDGGFLLVQFASSTKQDCTIEKQDEAGLHNREAGLHVSRAGLHPKDADERTPKELLKEPNPQPKEAGGSGIPSEQVTLGELQNIAASLPESIRVGLTMTGVERDIAKGVEDVGRELFVSAWRIFVENRDLTGMRLSAWEVFKKEVNEWVVKAEQRIADREQLKAIEEQLERERVAECEAQVPARIAQLQRNIAENIASLDNPFDAETLQGIREEIADDEKLLKELTA
jgi:hypothetical protein